MICGKRHIFGILFFIYFLLYIVSPLCYAKDRLSELDGDYAIAHTSKCDTKKICVVWELILSKLFQPKNDENNYSGIHFFIKKSPTVISSNNITKISHPEFTESDNKILIYSSPEPLIFIVQPKDNDHRDGFCCLSSGLSPPIF